MSLKMRIMDSKHKNVVLFDTEDLKKFTLEQLQVLRQQIKWEMEERLKL